MAPHVNKGSPLDGAQKLQVTVIVTTSELSQFTYPYIIIVQPSSSRVNSSRELYCCCLLSCQLMPRIAIFRLCLPQQFKAMQSTATGTTGLTDLQLVRVICIHSAKQCVVAQLCRVNIKPQNLQRLAQVKNKQPQHIKHAGQSGSMHICDYR